LKTRKVVSFGIVIAAISIFYIFDYLPSIKIAINSGKQFSDQHIAGMYYDVNVYHKSVSKGNETGSFKVEYENNKTNQKLSRTFKADSLCPVDIYSARYVYLIEQKHGVDHLNLVVWDILDDRLTNIMSLPKVPLRDGIQMGSLLSTKVSSGKIGHISPDGKYLLLVLSSLAGDGIDLWAINLQHRTAQIVLPNSIFDANEAVWTPEYAVLSGFGNAVKVDLRNFKAKIIKVDWKEDGKR
jgi:hypothetical protein